MFLKPKIETAAAAGMELLEVALRNPAYFGKTLGEVMSGLPAGAHIVALRRAHHNKPASPGVVAVENDVMLVVATTTETLADASRALLGCRRPAVWSRIAATSIMYACSPRA
jgi:putative transport protein